MKIELCTASIEALEFAFAHSNLIHRIELCQNLDQGGTTPSLAWIEIASKQIETHVLIRPRPGDFIYSTSEKKIQLLDMERALNAGASGLVVGAQKQSGELDRDFMEEIVRLFPSIPFTFHRAIDLIPDWEDAFTFLLELGFHRVLTSGQAATCEAGTDTLLKMKKQLSGQMELMLGGGITKLNVRQLCQQIQPDSIHFSGTSLQKQAEKTLFETTTLSFDASKALEIISEIEKL